MYVYTYNIYIFVSEISGALELADVSSELPGLKRMPGITKWKVLLYGISTTFLVCSGMKF